MLFVGKGYLIRKWAGFTPSTCHIATEPKMFTSLRLGVIKIAALRNLRFLNILSAYIIV
jgi:hypothetical protein